MSSSGNKWIKKKYKPKKVCSKRKKSNEFIIDETQIKVDWLIGSQFNISGSGLQSIEPKQNKQRQILLQIDLSIYLQKERTMLVAECFIASLINK